MARSAGTGQRRRVRAPQIFARFLKIGATTFGGMWASTQSVEKELVTRAGWLDGHELQNLFVVSTLVPAPKFTSLGALVGFKTGGWSGSVAAVAGLCLPGYLLVVAGAALFHPDLLNGALAPLNTSVGVAVVGLLFGNAYHQIRRSGASRRDRLVGICLSAAIFAAIVAGVPLIAAAIVGFVAGAVLLRPAPLPNAAGDEL